MKIEAVNRAGMKMIGEAGFTLLQNTFNFFLLLFKYSFLFVLLFLLASHESANPKLGKTTFEFYSSEFRTAFLNPDISSIENNRFSDEESLLITRFYLERQFMPAWTNNFEINSSFIDLMELLGNSYQYGLLPSTYGYSKLLKLQNELSGTYSDNKKHEIRAHLERKATCSAIRFMNHLAAGIRSNDTTQAYQLFLNTLPFYLNAQLEKNMLREGILDLQPKNRQYMRLQRAAARYLNTAIWDTLNCSMDQLASDQKLIAEKLIQRGYLDRSFASDSAALHAALRSYQKAHDLDVNGEVDMNTLHSLTTNIKEEFYKIAVNLDRLRKDNLIDEDYILVNIPEYRLHYYNHSGYGSDFNVIVGKKETPTPIVTSQVEWVIANPYWTVPQSITQNEIIPLIKKDSMYLQKHGFSIVDKNLNTIDASNFDWNSMNPNEFAYWFRQTNDNNALGVIKFLFPNPHSVYVHDTQAKKLFNNRVRAYSHGCIRLQNPELLAQMIVSAYSESSRTLDIQSTIHKKVYKEIKIERAVPIYIRYYSCTGDSAGNLQFHPDIYALDNEAINEIFGTNKQGQ
jgi:L,D-transpeptidase YcbB